MFSSYYLNPILLSLSIFNFLFTGMRIGLNPFSAFIISEWHSLALHSCAFTQNPHAIWVCIHFHLLINMTLCAINLLIHNFFLSSTCDFLTETLLILNSKLPATFQYCIITFSITYWFDSTCYFYNYVLPWI